MMTGSRSELGGGKRGCCEDSTTTASPSLAGLPLHSKKTVPACVGVSSVSGWRGREEEEGHEEDHRLCGRGGEEGGGGGEA